jgi:hypothetical protein
MKKTFLSSLLPAILLLLLLSFPFQSDAATYAWHTFYGQSGTDSGQAIGVDANGNVYITGQSSASWNGPSNHPPIHDHAGTGMSDIFVLKLDSSGTYQWHTFYGSSAYNDAAHSIAVDKSGNVYVTGDSSASWNGDGNAAPKHNFDGIDGYAQLFVLKLNNLGQFQWHTFYGKAMHDTYPNAIAADGYGNVFVTGYSDATWSGSLSIPPGHAHSGGNDIFVLKLDSNGAWHWNTFYGSGNDDHGNGIATDSSGNVYVTGYSMATWNGPAPANTPVNLFSGTSKDAFVLKLNTSGDYQWHTFHGSTDNDAGDGIVVGSDNYVYVTGWSDSTWGSPVDPVALTDARFVLKLESSGAYQRHTFAHGGTGFKSSIALDKNNSVYVTSYEWITWGSPLHPHSGGALDIVALKLYNDLTLQWNTFYGSNSNTDSGIGIAVDVFGNVFVTGLSAAKWQGDGLTPPTDPLHAYTGGNDAFVLKLAVTTCSGSEAHVVSPSYYGSTIQNAYENAVDGSLIQLQAVTFEEEEVLVDNNALNPRVTFRGGYECDFLSNPGFSTLHGKMIISKGRVNIDSLIIR